MTEDGKVLVAWVDGSESAVHPQDLYLLEGSVSVMKESFLSYLYLLSAVLLGLLIVIWICWW